jgi:hypothetical protein
MVLLLNMVFIVCSVVTWTLFNMWLVKFLAGERKGKL